MKTQKQTFMKLLKITAITLAMLLVQQNLYAQSASNLMITRSTISLDKKNNVPINLSRYASTAFVTKWKTDVADFSQLGSNGYLLNNNCEGVMKQDEISGKYEIALPLVEVGE